MEGKEHFEAVLNRPDTGPDPENAPEITAAEEPFDIDTNPRK